MSELRDTVILLGSEGIGRGDDTLGYEILLTMVETYSLYPLSVIIVDAIDIVKSMFMNGFYFSISIFYLFYFGNVFIKLSFGENEAKRNFWILTAASSLLYLVNRYYIVETLHTKPLMLISLAGFSIPLYLLTNRLKSNLICPECGKLLDYTKLRLYCDDCGKSLYSWALF